MKGQFRFSFQDGTSIILPNTVVQEGEDAFLKMIFQGNNTIIPAAGDYWLGLCDQTPGQTDVLSSITTEPTVLNGYARQALSRDSVGWPTIDIVNARKRITSKLLTFTAVVGDFDKPFSRAFICSVSSGSTGTLFAFSAALDAAITLTLGTSFKVQYEFFAD